MPAEEFGGASKREVDAEGEERLKEEGRMPGGVQDGQKIFAVLLAVTQGKGHNSPNVCDLKKERREEEKEKRRDGLPSVYFIFVLASSFPPSLPSSPPSLLTFKRGLEGLSIHTKTLFVPASANARLITSSTAPRSVISTHSFLNPHSSKLD
jgi:hypothetical protein